MDFLPCTSFLLTLMSIIFLSVSTDQTNITAEAGKNTCLPCRSPDNKSVIAVEWIRPDLGSEYVLLYRNKKINTDHQHPSFKDRVDLLDKQMKDGNVSLVLRNVTTDDRGAYECRVVPTNSWMEAVLTINLVVVTSPGERRGGNRDGSGLVGLVVVLSVIVPLAVVIFVVYLNRKKASCRNPNPNQPLVDPVNQPLTDQNRPAEQRVQSDLQDDGSRTSADQLSSRITD